MPGEVLDCRLGGLRASRVIGVPYRTLDNWVRTGLLPVEVPARGKGTKRGFSFLDLIRARAMTHLRGQGISVQMIRKVLGELTQKWGVNDPLLFSGRLIVAGDQLFWALDDAKLLHALTGQLASTTLLILPVGQIVAEVRVKVAEMIAV